MHNFVGICDLPLRHGTWSNLHVLSNKITISRPALMTILATGLLTSCKVGPDYKRPDLPMPEAWVLKSPMRYSAEDLSVPTTVGGVAVGAVGHHFIEVAVAGERQVAGRAL